MKKALEMKGTDREEIERDPALAPVREDPEYRKMFEGGHTGPPLQDGPKSSWGRRRGRCGWRRLILICP